MLVDLRAQVVDAHRGGRPKREAVAMKGASSTFASSKRLGFAARFARLGTGLAGRLPVATPWTGARDLPKGPVESFRAWWKRTDGGANDG